MLCGKAKISSGVIEAIHIPVVNELVRFRKHDCPVHKNKYSCAASTAVTCSIPSADGLLSIPLPLYKPFIVSSINQSDKTLGKGYLSIWGKVELWLGILRGRIIHSNRRLSVAHAPGCFNIAGAISIGVLPIIPQEVQQWQM
jgi:hypothetical protein